MEIGNVLTLVSALTAAVVSIISAIRVKQVHMEVRTMNELTIGQLGEATETRRIETIPVEERSKQENRHMNWKDDQE